ncbi:MAG: hypothetical protein WC269_05050, partial [Candidatus Gracilibacteria bacterium]
MSKETPPQIDILEATPHTQIATQIAEPCRDTHEKVFTRIKKFPEIVMDPNSPALAGFHKLMRKIFNEGEVEPLEVFQEELARRGPSEFICIVMSDPLLLDVDEDEGKDSNTVVTGAYGSVQ